MKDIENWIYIVFIMIAAISSIIKSINKKRRQDEERQPARDVITTSDGSSGDFYPSENPPSNPPKKPNKQRAQPKTPKYQSIMANDEGQSSFTAGNVSMAMQEEEERATITLNDMPANADEWRKAFIYNEVFGRKY